MSFAKGFAGLRPGFFNSTHSSNGTNVVDYVVTDEHDNNLVSDESYEEESSEESDLAGSISSLQDGDLDEVDSILSGSASVHSEMSMEEEEVPELVSTASEECLSLVFGQSVAAAAEAQQRNRQNKGNKKRSQQQQNDKKKHNKAPNPSHPTLPPQQPQQIQPQQPKAKNNLSTQQEQNSLQNYSQSTQNQNSMNQNKTKNNNNSNNITNNNTTNNNNNTNNNNKVKKQKQKQKQKSKLKREEIGKCNYSVCDIKDHVIYANDEYCQIWCTEQCKLLLHQACWEVHLAAVRAEHPMLVEFMPCATPNCYGVVRKLHNYSNNNVSKHNIPSSRINEQIEIQRQIQRVQTIENDEIENNTNNNNNDNDTDDNNTNNNNKTQKDKSKSENSQSKKKTSSTKQINNSNNNNNNNNIDDSIEEFDLEHNEFSDEDEIDEDETELDDAYEGDQYSIDDNSFSDNEYDENNLSDDEQNEEEEEEGEEEEDVDPLYVRVTGVVTSVKDGRYGFILGAMYPSEKENWKHTLFFHFGQVLSQDELPFRVGDIVEYSVDVENERGASAVDIILKERPQPSKIPDHGLSELGEVTVTKETYGFIHSKRHPKNVFYHTSAVTGDVLPEVGDRVSFFTTYNQRTKKPNAVSVTILSRSEADDLEFQNNNIINNNNNNNENDSNPDSSKDLNTTDEDENEDEDEDSNDSDENQSPEEIKVKRPTQGNAPTPKSHNNNKPNTVNSSAPPKKLSYAESLLKSKQDQEQQEHDQQQPQKQQEHKQQENKSKAVLFSGNAIDTHKPTPQRERIVSEDDEILVATQPRHSPEAPIGAVGSHLEPQFMSNNNQNHNNKTNTGNNSTNTGSSSNSSSSNGVNSAGPGSIPNDGSSSNGSVSPALTPTPTGGGGGGSGLNGFAPQSFLPHTGFSPAPGMPSATSMTGSQDPWLTSHRNHNNLNDTNNMDHHYHSNNNTHDLNNHNNGSNNNNNNYYNNKNNDSNTDPEYNLNYMNSNNNNNNNNNTNTDNPMENNPDHPNTHSINGVGLPSRGNHHEESNSLFQEAYDRVQQLPPGHQLREQVEHNPFQHIHSADELLQMKDAPVLPFLQAYHMWMGRNGVVSHLQEENQYLRRQLQEQSRQQMPGIAANPLLGAATSLYSNGGPHHRPHQHLPYSNVSKQQQRQQLSPQPSQQQQQQQQQPSQQQQHHALPPHLGASTSPFYTPPPSSSSFAPSSFHHPNQPFPPGSSNTASGQHAPGFGSVSTLGNASSSSSQFHSHQPFGGDFSLHQF